jgi:hypothetical protein
MDRPHVTDRETRLHIWKVAVVADSREEAVLPLRFRVGDRYQDIYHNTTRRFQRSSKQICRRNPYLVYLNL